MLSALLRCMINELSQHMKHVAEILVCRGLLSCRSGRRFPISYEEKGLLCFVIQHVSNFPIMLL